MQSALGPACRRTSASTPNDRSMHEESSSPAVAISKGCLRAGRDCCLFKRPECLRNAAMARAQTGQLAQPDFLSTGDWIGKAREPMLHQLSLLLRFGLLHLQPWMMTSGSRKVSCTHRRILAPS